MSSCLVFFVVVYILLLKTRIRDATSCTLNNTGAVCLLLALELSNNVVQRTEIRFKSLQSCEDRLLLNQVESAMRKSILKKVRVQLRYTRVYDVNEYVMLG